RWGHPPIQRPSPCVSGLTAEGAPAGDGTDHEQRGADQHRPQDAFDDAADTEDQRGDDEDHEYCHDRTPYPVTPATAQHSVAIRPCRADIPVAAWGTFEPRCDARPWGVRE